VQKLLNLLLLPNMKTAAMSVQELLRDYINKACALATKLGVLEGILMAPFRYVGK